MDSMELRTHTRLWQVEKRLYKLYDYTLPMPISIRMLGILTAAIVPWFTLMRLLHVHFGPPFGHLLWLAPPVLLAIWANKPVAEGKRLGELVLSQVSYFGFQARRYAGLRPDRRPAVTHVRAEVWRPDTPLDPALLDPALLDPAVADGEPSVPEVPAAALAGRLVKQPG